MEELKDVLEDIASPSSKNFGKHMSREEIEGYTGSRSTSRHVIDFLQSRGLQIDQTAELGEYIFVTGKVGDWEEMLETEFHHFQHEEKLIIRALEYSLPHELKEHVHAVFNTVHV